MQPEDVLEYWFTGDEKEQMDRWFMQGRALDTEIRARFGDAVEQAVSGSLDSWATSPEGRVALIVLLDQFTRHVFRDTPRFTDGDDRAQHLAQEAIADAGWKDLDPAYRFFAIVPFEHAEDYGLQRIGEHEAQALFEDHPSWDVREYFAEHQAIVERFGRLPDRNHILGRASTPEEAAFLQAESRPWFERQDV